MKRVNTLFELKRIEEEKTDREEYEKEGGYSTWVKMVNNNR